MTHEEHLALLARARIEAGDLLSDEHALSNRQEEIERLRKSVAELRGALSDANTELAMDGREAKPLNQQYEFGSKDERFYRYR